MRKIEQQMVKAMKANKAWQSGNTEVIPETTQTCGSIELHGHIIATFRWYAPYSELLITPYHDTFREWPTRTTVSRLRALGVRASIKQFAPCINGKAI